jgi:hypothetical protein
MARARSFGSNSTKLACLLFLLIAQPLWAAHTLGVFINEEEAFPGYTLFAADRYTDVYLIDNEGRLVNSWPGTYEPALSVYLLENGDLLRTVEIPVVTPFTAGGAGGRVEKYDWDGTLLWTYDYASDFYLQHHDIEPLPNGNVLINAWEYKTKAEAVAAGRDPGQLTQNELWPDHVIEVEPTLPLGGNIVWEWHAWDHLIQDFDPSKANYGVVEDHPELVDINWVAQKANADWNHVNAVAYHEAFDQIILTPRKFSEIWVIDHSTTTAEAAGHTGGARGKGGDLLYRWGNPLAYKRGVADDATLFKPHDGRWIPPGLPGGENMLIFNNGNNRPSGKASSVDEFVPASDTFGDYPTLSAGETYGPTSLAWTYFDPVPGNFYADTKSGAQRLPNGNTLICNSPEGTFFEINAKGETVWKYVNPVHGKGPRPQGTIPTNNYAFRATKFPADYAGFSGQDLTPGAPLEGCEYPGSPTITLISDNDACIQDGLTITFTPGTGTERHDLYMDGLEVERHFISGTSFDPGDSVQHSYTVRAILGSNVCYAESAGVLATDAGGDCPLGDMTGLRWTDGETLEWDADLGASLGYRVYRGVSADLPALLDLNVDSCLAFTASDRFQNTASGLTEIPPAGELYWYLVTGVNAAGESGAGNHSGGPRVLNDSGSCP